jgi:hypothetical protein
MRVRDTAPDCVTEQLEPASFPYPPLPPQISPLLDLVLKAARPQPKASRAATGRALARLAAMRCVTRSLGGEHFVDGGIIDFTQLPFCLLANMWLPGQLPHLRAVLLVLCSDTSQENRP